MSCNTLIEPACKAAGAVLRSVAGQATGGVLNGIAQAVTDGVKWIVENTATWWLRIPSPDLASETAITAIQRWLLPITTAVAVAGVIAAGARMALTRRANPLLDVVGGLLTLAAASTLGITAAALLLKAGDAWSTWVLQVSTGDQFTQRLVVTLSLGGAAAPAVVLVLGVIAIVLSLVQAALMLFRQVALLILAGVLPLAAAGSIAPMTRTWVRKIVGWMLALICYKPAAAAVYAAAFTMVGSGHSTQTVLMGFVMMLLSVLMLPALMKFFTWTTGTIAGSGGGGQLLGAATLGAIAVGAMRSSGAGAAQGQAAYISSSLGPTSPGNGSGAPPGTPPPGSGGGGGSGPGAGLPFGPSGASPAGGGGSPAGPRAGLGGGWPLGAGAGSGPDSAGGAATSAGSAGSGIAGSSSATGGAAAAAASGAGAAATVVAETARTAGQAGRLAAGAMEPGDRS